MKNLRTLAAAVTLSALSALGQAPAGQPRFEVASIKPSDPGVNGFRLQSAPGGRFIASGATVKNS